MNKDSRTKKVRELMVKKKASTRVGASKKPEVSLPPKKVYTEKVSDGHLKVLKYIRTHKK